ncbi:MAG: hypothetical protein Q8M29_06990 [Bacteroidota bacterium]|nr:hypothetical protein [Bacteroidota bacterium]
MLTAFFSKLKRSPLAIISLFVSLSNWQLLFGIKATQWDMINFWLPWRYYIAECYRNGIVPLWNPYSQAGYPIHGDLQGPAYSLEAIATSFLTPINVYFLNYLYIFYLIVGAYGLYKLILFFVETLPNKELIETNRNVLSYVAAIAGVVYGLCGYNAWHGHYLYITISACLIPWVYYYFFRILQQPHWLDAIKLALVIWWQITAGNPSFIIVSFYFLIIAFVWRVIYNFIKKQSGQNKKIFFTVGFAALLTIVLSAPVFLNAYYVFPYTSRAGGISAEWAAEESILWRNIFSFFSSITCIEREIRIGAEAPIYDLYIGIPTLLFAFFGIRKLRSFWINVLSVIAILAFLLSLGLQTPLFKFFHSYLPFFNVFRMPNLIFIYTLMYLCLMSALGFLYILKNKIRMKSYLIFALVTVSILSAGVIYFNYGYPENGKNYVTDYSSIHSFLWTASQTRKIGISLLFAVLVLFAGWILVKKQNYKALMVLVLIDAGINYNIGAIARVMGQGTAKFSNDFMSGLPTGFGVPDNIRNNKVACLSSRLSAFWMNSSTFLQQPSYLNDNNFELTNYMKLMNDHKEELNYFIDQPLYFLADSLVEHKNFKTDTLKRKAIATVEQNDYVKMASLQLKTSIEDNIHCEKFLPQHVVFNITNKNRVAFLLQQNYTKFWKVKLNGKEVTPLISYYSFPCLILEGGVNKVEFVYEVKYFHVLFTFSLLLAFILIGILILLLVKGKTKKTLVFLCYAAIIAYGLFVFFTTGTRIANCNLDKELSANKDLMEQFPKSLRIVNTKDAYVSKQNNTYEYYNLMFNEDLAGLMSVLHNSTNDIMVYTCYKSIHSMEIEKLIELNFGNAIEERKMEDGFIRVYKRNPVPQPVLFSREDDFNNGENEWFTKDSLGNKSLKVMKGNEYGGGVDFILKDIGAKARDLVYAECEILTNENNMPGMCMSIDRDGVNKGFYTYGNLHLKKNVKGMTGFFMRLPEFVKETDKITLFYWNNTDKEAVIDNMKVKVIDMN